MGDSFSEYCWLWGMRLLGGLLGPFMLVGGLRAAGLELLKLFWVTAFGFTF